MALKKLKKKYFKTLTQIKKCAVIISDTKISIRSNKMQNYM